MSAFWKVTRYARAARFWLLLALAALAWMGSGEVRAQDYTECYSDSAGGSGVASNAVLCPSRGVAHERARARLPGNVFQNETCPDNFFVQGILACTVRYRQGTSGPTTRRAYPIGIDCIGDGVAWNPTTLSCDCSTGFTFRPDGTCKSCESMNSEPGFGTTPGSLVVRNYKERCLGGCTYRAKPMLSTCAAIGGQPAGTFQCSGEWEFTGGSCSVSGGDPPMLESPIPGEPGGPPLPPQECAPAGEGQTFCMKKNGDHCYNAGSGKQICWAPGQTGEKGEGPIAQVRKPGTETPLPASMQTDGGDAITAEGEPMTVTTVVNGALTITTTTQNYVTENGTDAKPTNDGESADGEDDELQDGDASGGTDCDTPPIATDPQLEMIATQAWATRCAVEAGNAASVSGDIGDCQSPFSVEGTNANAEQLRAMRVQICGAEARAEGQAEAEGIATGEMDGLADALMPGEGESVFAEGGDEGSISTTLFGGGAATCPASGWSLGPIGEINTTALCDGMAALRLLFLAVATIWALRIVGGE